MIIDFSNPWAFIFWYVITVGLLVVSYKKKKAKICIGPIVYFIIILLIHSKNPDWFRDIYVHRWLNFIGLGVSICMFVVMDEVETRRKVISKVFKNRYKKDKLPSETGELLDEEEEELDEEVGD